MGIIQSINKNLIRELEDNEAIALLVKQRLSFENWMKIQIIQELINAGIPKENIIPERNHRVDITFYLNKKNYTIELKTLPTSYIYDNAREYAGNGINNIHTLYSDIDKMKYLGYEKGFLIFVVYPFDRKNRKHNLEWKLQRDKIKKLSKISLERDINFANGLKGVLYSCDLI